MRSNTSYGGGSGSNHKVTSSSSRRGFTLVELLVVIGIIAVLISLLLPELSKARENARLIKCASQLRQFGQAMQMHANEHHGYFPLAGYINIVGYTGGSSSGTQTGLPVQLGDAWQQKYDYTLAYGQNTVTSLPTALARYLGDAAPQFFNTRLDEEAFLTNSQMRALFTCPSDANNDDSVLAGEGLAETSNGYPGQENWIVEWNQSYNIAAPSSYGFNYYVLGWDAAKPSCCLRGNSSGCVHPADTMLMMDMAIDPTAGGALGYEVHCNHANASLADSFLNSVSKNFAGNGVDTSHGYFFDVIRHRGRINILYVDGHVESMPILVSGGSDYDFSSAAGTNLNNTPSGYTPGANLTDSGTNAVYQQSVLGTGSLAGVSLNKDFAYYAQ